MSSSRRTTLLALCLALPSGACGARTSLDESPTHAPCSAGATLCPGAGSPYCANVLVDAANCGRCGERCAQDYETCEDGQCVARCRRAPLQTATQIWAQGIGQAYFADVDGDGDLDVLARDASDEGHLEVLVHEGSGMLTANPIEDRGEQNVDLEVDDMDGDGFVDMVTVSRDPRSDVVPTLVVRWNDGATAFSSSEYWSDVCNEDDASSTALGDFNEDGLLDMLLLCGGVHVTAFLNRGARSFEALAPVELPHTAVRTADLDADGHLDLLTAFEGGLSLLPGDGSAHFSEPRALVRPVGDGVRVAVGDVNADGYDDLAVAHSAHDDGVGVYLSEAGQSYARANKVAAVAPVHDIDLWDVDDDGVLDLVFDGGRGSQSYVAVARGFGDGSFGAPASYACCPGAEDVQTWQIQAVDYDGDGSWEIARVGGGIYLIERLGDGQLGAPRALHEDQPLCE